MHFIFEFGINSDPVTVKEQEGQIDEIFNDLDSDEMTLDSSMDPDLPLGVDDNSFSEALEYISEDTIETEDSTSEVPAIIPETRAPLATGSIQLGADNDNHDGNDLAQSSTDCFCYPNQPVSK